MRTIEQVAFDRYNADQKLPERKRIGASDYLEWAVLGAKEALRWIPIEEELPGNNKSVIAKNGSNIWISTLMKGRIVGIKYSGEESFEATHWRPIERS